MANSMTDMLKEIIANKRFEIDIQKQHVSLKQLQNELTDTKPLRSMRTALIESASGIISEFKRRSPSNGWIKEDAEIDKIIPAYTQAGAAALSILTDEKFFGGNLKDIRKVRMLTNIPILRKDFVIDEYQLYQAKIAGADAILLIAAILERGQCEELAGKAHELGLEVLLEIHHDNELSYTTFDIDMIGINNRNLKTFHTNVEISFQLAGQLPQNVLLVSESGISNPGTVKKLRIAGYRGFLIGETFMKTENPGDTLMDFITQLDSLS
jgi:indole-3-glycerol phosphate synthase